MPRKLALGLLLSAIAAPTLYLCAVVLINPAETWAAMRRLSGPGWAWVLLLSLFNYGLRFARWHLCIGHLSRRQIPLAWHGAVYLAGFAFTTTPGKVGEAVRGAYLRARHVRYETSLAVFLFERILDLATIVVLAALASHAFARYQFLLWLVLAGTAACLALLHSGLAGKMLNWLAHTNPAKAVARMAQMLHKTLLNASVLLGWRPLLGGLLVGLVAWGAEGVGLHYILAALGFDASLPLVVGIYALSMLAGALSFMPGGLGSSEAVMVLCLTALGCPLPMALAATLICRAATLWFAMLLGLLACLGLGWRMVAQTAETAEATGQVIERLPMQAIAPSAAPPSGPRA